MGRLDAWGLYNSLGLLLRVPPYVQSLSIMHTTALLHWQLRHYSLNWFVTHFEPEEVCAFNRNPSWWCLVTVFPLLWRGLWIVGMSILSIFIIITFFWGIAPNIKDNFQTAACIDGGGYYSAFIYSKLLTSSSLITIVSCSSVRLFEASSVVLQVWCCITLSTHASAPKIDANWRMAYLFVVIIWHLDCNHKLIALV